MDVDTPDRSGPGAAGLPPREEALAAIPSLWGRLCYLAGNGAAAAADQLHRELFWQWLALPLSSQREAIEQLLPESEAERARELARIYELGASGALIPPGATESECQLFRRDFEINIGLILAQSTFRLRGLRRQG